MGVTTDFSDIDSVFGCLHINWKEEYDWQNIKPSYQAVIRYFKIKSSKDAITMAVSDLERLLDFGSNFDDEEWYDYFMSDSSLGYYPPGGNQTYKEWLEDILEILKEPMEETEKYFIVKSAFDAKWEKLSEEDKKAYNALEEARRVRMGYYDEN